MVERVLLCGEGPTDYGTKEYGTNQWQEGPVHPIIRKTSGLKFLFEPIEKGEVKKLRIQRAKVKGHAAKSYKLSMIARERKINTVVCYVDADKISGNGKKELNFRKSFQEIYDQVQLGFEKFNDTHKGEDIVRITGIPMVPLTMIECWLLSDEKAFVKCFGKAPIHPRLPSEPEFIWGEKKNPISDYPKNLMKRVLNQFPGKESTRETFKEIAEKIDIAVLRNKCPISFGKFYSDVRPFPGRNG